LLSQAARLDLGLVERSMARLAATILHGTGRSLHTGVALSGPVSFGKDNVNSSPPSLTIKDTTRRAPRAARVLNLTIVSAPVLRVLVHDDVHKAVRLARHARSSFVFWLAGLQPPDPDDPGRPASASFSDFWL